MRIANVPKLIKITPEGEDMLLSYCTRILFLLFTFCLSFKLIYLFRILLFLLLWNVPEFQDNFAIIIASRIHKFLLFIIGNMWSYVWTLTSRVFTANSRAAFVSVGPFCIRNKTINIGQRQRQRQEWKIWNSVQILKFSIHLNKLIFILCHSCLLVK